MFKIPQRTSWKWLEEIIIRGDTIRLAKQLGYKRGERLRPGALTLESVFGERLEGILSDGLGSCSGADWAVLFESPHLLIELNKRIRRDRTPGTHWRQLADDYATRPTVFSMRQKGTDTLIAALGLTG